MSKQPAKKSTAAPERRMIDGSLRAINKKGQRTIYGYAALFSPSQTQDMGGWREEVHPNAFDRCLKGSPDVVAFFNHDSNALPLARTSSRTLRLSTDRRGLKYEFDAPDTSLARDLVISMERGDVHQSSYGFRCLSDSWRNDKDGTPIRTVLDADLIDVSPVVFPATVDTTSGVRTALRSAPAAIRERLLGASQKTKSVDAVDDGSGDDDEYLRSAALALLTRKLRT